MKQRAQLHLHVEIMLQQHSNVRTNHYCHWWHRRLDPMCYSLNSKVRRRNLPEVCLFSCRWHSDVMRIRLEYVIVSMKRPNSIYSAISIGPNRFDQYHLLNCFHSKCSGMGGYFQRKRRCFCFSFSRSLFFFVIFMFYQLKKKFLLSELLFFFFNEKLTIGRT